MKLLLTVAFAMALGILALSYQTPGRIAVLGNDQGCFRELYTRHHAEAKVAMIGSSRIRRGFDPDRVAAGLGLPPLGVVNLAHPGNNPLLDFEVLTEMLEKGRIDPDMILAGVVPVSWRQHEIEMEAVNKTPFPRVALSNGLATIDNVAAGGQEVLRQIAGQQEESGAMALWNSLTLNRTRLEKHIKLALGGRSTWKVFSSVSDAIDRDRPNLCFRRGWAKDQILPGRLAQKRRYENAFEGQQAIGGFDPQDFLTNPNYLTERVGLQQIAQLARSRGITAYAIYIPGVHTPQLPQDFFPRFEAEIGMALLTLPSSLLEALGTEHYSDPTHLALQGRIMASDWLATQLKPELAAR